MNLLVDPVFRVQTAQSIEVLNLPALLQALGEDRVESLPALQRHQEDAFHIFLCYLSGAVLAREGQTNPQQSEEFWRAGIRNVTGRQNDCAWTFTVEDLTLPAFMQAPTAKIEDFAMFKSKALTPDELDLLATARNHDVKASRVNYPQIEDWIYSLVNIQTMSGYFGRDHYGIARMNSGSGSRPRVRVEYSRRLGQNYCDDIARLINTRAGLLRGAWGYQSDGLVVTWIIPWDLKSSIALKELDPFFIEIARPVRISLCTSGHPVALLSTSTAPRLAAKEMKGLMGDPWIPVDLKKHAALTVGGRGFTPERLSSLIFEQDYELQAMQHPVIGKEDQSCSFHASVLVGGQGKTDGFHDVDVRIPARIAGFLFRPNPTRDLLAERSKTALGDSAKMQNRILRPALFTLLEAGPKQVNTAKREISEWVDTAIGRYSRSWFDDFFPWLWRSLDVPSSDSARLEWLIALKKKARATLKEAILRYPARDGRRLRAQVNAEGIFYGCVHNVFPELTEEIHDNE